ncbi:hypothetical protein ASG56_20520 [Rhodococcus sp. Leaf7]|uniref:hypothetical protein n=1 Tax=unclassified Rhodococcus (in: high G+C Gram-positive bacteria) TaxID=192944 RepID=UPI0006FFB456|nr:MULTISPECIES: hypothetical protein [unclassified Rhodococcus (in: high G+C Gram-positive bacteria)]KQU03164.1 hypothetical protein ASG56_20520 [Rhodococcus sp. Leaf7]KQU38964.1 hypothetical protein ASG64_18005 [Rhodococcus sp. Leaf247]
MSTPVPRPGQHLPSHSGADAVVVDPGAVLTSVDALVAEADEAAEQPFGEGTTDPHGLVTLTRQARILERAHDILVDALSSVDNTAAGKN